MKGLLGRKGLVFAAILFAVHCTPARAEELSSGNEVVNYGVGVTFTGKIATRLEYGAPGFGEDPKTDAKENIFLLVLDKPIDVHVDQSRPGDVTDTNDFDGVKEMQVVFTGKRMFSKKIIGKKVKVTGTLFQAHTGHHHTDVLIEVDTVERLK